MLNLTQQEYKLLLLIHAAKCDYFFHDKEKIMLEKLADKSTLQRLEKVHEERKVESFSYLIKYFNEFYPTLQSRLELKKGLIELFHVDEKFCQFEKGFEKYFNHLAEIKI